MTAVEALRPIPSVEVRLRGEIFERGMVEAEEEAGEPAAQGRFQ